MSLTLHVISLRYSTWSMRALLFFFNDAAAPEIYTDLIDRVMAQSSPAECDAMGEQMQRIVEMLKDD